MNEKSSNQCEHSLERSKSIVDIFCAVFGILLTLSQISIAMTSYQLAARAEALSFQLQAVEGHYQYEIIEDGNISSIPAPRCGFLLSTARCALSPSSRRTV